MLATSFQSGSLSYLKSKTRYISIKRMEGLDPITDRERGLVQIDFIAIFGQNLTKYDFNVYLKNHGETASFNFF